ncbi:hypothetical protein D3C78_1063820 [compost metagenome]
MTKGRRSPAVKVIDLIPALEALKHKIIRVKEVTMTGVKGIKETLVHITVSNRLNQATVKKNKVKITRNT